jgi:hypothetical protein
MHVDHRKPVVAFVVLAILAAVVVGFQRADAHTGRYLTSFATVTVRAEGGLSLPAGRAGAGREHLAAVSRAWLAAPGPGTTADHQPGPERGSASRAQATRGADRPDRGRLGSAEGIVARHVDTGRAGTPARASRSARRTLEEVAPDTISRLRSRWPGHAAREGLRHLRRDLPWTTRYGRSGQTALDGLAHPRRGSHGLRGPR